MPWYTWLYIAMLVLLGLASAHDQHSEGRGVLAVLVDAASSLILIYFVLAYFNGVNAFALVVNVILAAFAIGWSLYDGFREMRTVVKQSAMSYDPELSPRANIIVDRAVEIFAGSAGVVVVLPAIACALAVITRAI